MRFKQYLKEAREPEAFITDLEELAGYCEGLFSRPSNFTVHPDGYVSVHKDVSFKHSRYKRLPIRFRHVEGNFDMSDGKFQTLEGCPESITGSFRCNKNKLKSLVGGPKTVGLDYNCDENYLEDLVGAPTNIVKSFDASDNVLETMKGAPETVGGDFCVQNNHIDSWEHSPKVVGWSYKIDRNDISSMVGISDHIDQIGNEHNQGYLNTDSIGEGGIGLVLIKSLAGIDNIFFQDNTYQWDKANGGDKVKVKDILKKYLRKPDDIFDCQAELVEHGFEAFAQL